MASVDVNQSYQIPDELWKKIEPLLPPEVSRSRGGRPRMDNRRAMEAILYVFQTNCKWKKLPRNLGAPSTVYSRFREWREAGVFQRMWQAGLLTYDEMREMVWYGKEWRMPPKR